MQDLLYLLVVAVFALASWGFVRLCQQLMEEKA